MTLGRKRHALGFTLIEMMVTLLVGSVITTAMWGTVYHQNLMMIQHSDEDDIHRRANATLDLLGRQLREAGAMMVSDGNALGVAALGQCTSDTTAVGASPATKCSAVDGPGNTSDRLRTVRGLTFSASKQSSSVVDSAAFCNGLVVSVPNILHYDTYVTNPKMLTGGWAVVSGSCSVTSRMSNNAVKITGITQPASSTSHCYEFNYKDMFTGANSLSCAQGYAAGYNITSLQLADFFLAPSTDSSLPTQLQENLSEATFQAKMPLAPAVSRFEVRYGFDTGSQLSGKLAACPSCQDDPYPNFFGSILSWCRDPRAPDAGGGCTINDSNGVQLTTAQLLSRITAVYVELDFQRNTKRANASGGQAAQITRTYRRLYAIKSKL